MKGTKDDEKTVSPMFPRLHVNDTEKGGPRPPPRNKMALYEQLSVPTQRFNSGSASGFPLPPNNAGTSVPSQGGRQERMLFSSFSMPSTTAARETSVGMEPLSSTGEPGSFYTCHISNSRNTYVNKFGNEDDCRVPTFVDSGFGSCSNNDELYFESQRLTCLSSNHLGHSKVTPGNSLPKAAAATCNSPVQIQNSHDKHVKRPTAIDLRSRQENLKESVVDKDGSENIVPYPLSREKIGERIEHAHQSPNQENQRSPDDNLQGLHDCNAQLNQDRVQFLQGKDGRVENISSVSLEDVQKVHILRLKTDSCSRAFTGDGHGSPDEPLEDNSGGLFLGRDVDRNDDVSETSMVDSISGLDISPDDVVGVIGKKHFWKARRAIVNQQRLFAVQVFELHRLIKVQRLIAGSPHLLLRDGTYVSKRSLKSSPSKKLPSEYLLKPPQLLLKPRATQKLNDNIECAAENVVGKPPPLPSVTDIVNKGLPGQLTYGQYSGSPSPAPVAADDKLGWCYHPPPGNQWLIPVMSSSEGLVYKPWAGPCPPTTGFMAPVYGSCGPMNLPPPYGIPASHPQGFGLFSGAPFAQTYIPPYNMPVMNPAISASAVEQVNPLAGPRPYRQAEQVVSTGEVNLNMHSRNSCNVSNQKSEGISCLQKFQASKESEIQGSTASSPPERVQGAVTRNGSDGRDALPLFPVAQATQGLHGGNVDKQHARVIRVVPHNPRSAPESAARIFQSIQEERKQ